MLKVVKIVHSLFNVVEVSISLSFDYWWYWWHKCAPSLYCSCGVITWPFSSSSFLPAMVSWFSCRGLQRNRWRLMRYSWKHWLRLLLAVMTLLYSMNVNHAVVAFDFQHLDWFEQ